VGALKGIGKLVDKLGTFEEFWIGLFRILVSFVYIFLGEILVWWGKSMIVGLGSQLPMRRPMGS